MNSQLREIAKKRSALIFRTEMQRRSLLDYFQNFSLGVIALHVGESILNTILKSKITKGLTIFSSLWAIVHRRK